MNGDRAIAILEDLVKGQLEARGDEMDELLAAGLVVEASPEGVAFHAQLEKLRASFPKLFGTVEPTPALVQSATEGLRRNLKSDWFRMRTSKEKLRLLEENLAELNRALGLIQNPASMALAREAAQNQPRLMHGAKYVGCAQIGSAVFAITQPGLRVLAELKTRQARFGSASLKAFLAKLDKAENKMRAFGQDVAALWNHVGYVRKGKANVVIGLVKTNLPAPHAARAYSAALAHANEPDVAVVCARNATQDGDTRRIQQKLDIAFETLVRAGFPRLPIIHGVAKVLLPYDPPHAGLARYSELYRHVRAARGGGDESYKLAARLMPVRGTPADLIQRALWIARELSHTRNAVVRRSNVIGMASVALASMVDTDQAAHGITHRFLDIERELVRFRLCSPESAEQHALECIAADGTPTEVVATVAALATNITFGAAPTNEQLAIASAFAKRFAY